MTLLRQPLGFGLRASRALVYLKYSLSLSVLWWLVALPAQAMVEMRVAIGDRLSQVTVGSSTPAVVKNQAGQGVGQIPQGRSVVVSPDGGGVRLADWRSQAFWVEPTGGGYVFINDSWYRGRVLVMPVEGKVTAVNWVDLEAYLYGVVGGEMPASWPQEALKAQAVAARSYALYRRDRTQGQLFDVDSTTASQVYRGMAGEATSVQAAVNATQGQVLTYGGSVIEAVFHSSSGGYTENSEDIWQRPTPYLRGVADFDQEAPVFRWSETFSAEQFSQRIPGIGRLQAVTTERATPRGRIVSIRLQGTAGTRVLTGTELRAALGLRSTLGSVSVAGDTIRVDGRGYGHGLGMSQWGARALAGRGYSYQQILAYYYQGSVLSNLRLTALQKQERALAAPGLQAVPLL
ncbi:SpoIID/LytB domain-containing protein [Nodosilinea sp. LEGE 07088]|uniref:SpoIID/LytB domain-containing protein n=1 Tax=Nodosilinea sp. LEGE 07088 TaxID=2777968 RepID=UPI00187EE653|nr:SpoIID/LytB domain-containing protein [Nodosilinea sp. LEGE 07088]MBE9139460.1 SpoIID/LytB domain-containing protein [Nodosilinea sp. LEGE 07088]